MIYLLLSITASTLIFVLFKLFSKYDVNTLQAIVTNYITACCIGVFTSETTHNFGDIFNAPWFLGAVILGFLFISIFNVMALTSQRNGLSVASVASKMSVIIPVVFGIVVYRESVGTQKLNGIAIALIAVYLTSVKKDSKGISMSNLLLPLLLFFGSGTIDTAIKYVETTYVPKGGIPIFSATIFSIAFVLGLLILGYQKIQGKFKFKPQSIIGGVVLGVVNYYSIYYLLKALQYKNLESSTLFTINNVAIVAVSTLIGLLCFREHISKINWLGILLALISIILVTVS